jgi:PAP2 superfamily
MIYRKLVKKISLIVVTIIGFWSCDNTPKNPNFQQDAAHTDYAYEALTALTTVIKHDLFPPMIASRIYGYAHVASYEALTAGAPQYLSLSGQLKGLENLPRPEADKEYCYPLASVAAYMKVGKKLTFSEDSMTNYAAAILAKFKAAGVPKDVFQRSVAFGDTIGGAIIKWSGKDNYLQMRSMPKYTVTPQNPTRWKPTAPGYDDALEPHWRKLRPYLLDSAAQFKPIPATPFDTVKSSKFYKEALEVYQSVQDSTPDRIATAWYWDDNPSALNNVGHVNFIRKKITPPGHWLHITMYATRQQKLDIFKATEAFAQVAIAEFDAFISCWDEKYRSEVIRPETYISKYIKPEFTPIIVTPPFPEYTSGHSVASGAAASVLTTLLGKNTAFTDSTEVIFGIEPRSYKSFDEAAEQAAVSRFYAGIHYRPAVDEGLKQGRLIGEYVSRKIKTRK